jgi:hypothetical protein
VRGVPALSVLVVLIVLVGCTGATPSPSSVAGGPSSATPVPTRAPLPRDLCANLGTDCTLEAGHYLAQLFEPNVAFELGSGWLNNVYSPRALQILHGETAGISFMSGPLQARDGSLGTSPRELLTYLAKRPGLTAGAIEDVTLGGQPAVVLDVTVGPAAVVLFERPIAGQQADPFQVSPTEHARFVALDVAGERVLIVIEALAPDDLASFLAQYAQPLLDSLTFPAPESS